MRLLHQIEGEIQAKRIINAMKKGINIDLYRVKILGDLKLSEKHDTIEDRVVFGEPTQIASVIEFSHCFFEGRVDFPNTIFLKKVSFVGSYFKKGAVFWPGPTEFQRSADFSHTNFCGKADFSYVKFKDNADFQEAVFRKDGHQQAEFSHTTFDSDVDFHGASFGRKAIFLGSCFRDYANFSSNIIFYEIAQFDDARFYETPWFYGCKFKENAKFRHVTFYRDVIFSHSTFEKDLILEGSRAGTIYFEGFENSSLLKSQSRIRISDIRKMNELINRLRNGQDEVSRYIMSKMDPEIKSLITAFDTTLQLDSANRVKFLNAFNDAIFSKSLLEEKPFHGLKLSKMTKIMIEAVEDPRCNRLIAEDAYPDLIIKRETLFGVRLGSDSRILLEGSYFGLLKFHWHILRGYLDNTTPSVYLSLIKGYRELGWTRDEDDCYYDYRLSRDKNKISIAADKLYTKMLNQTNFSKYIDPIASLSCGYGVRPTRTLSLSIAVILTYATIFWAKCTFWLSLWGDGLADHTNLPPYTSIVQFRDSAFQTIYIPNSQLADTSLLNAIQAIPNSLYLSSMIFISQAPSNWYISGFWKYVVMSERVLGWLLMALFIVVLTKKLIR